MEINDKLLFKRLFQSFQCMYGYVQNACGEIDDGEMKLILDKATDLYEIWNHRMLDGIAKDIIKELSD